MRLHFLFIHYARALKCIYLSHSRPWILNCVCVQRHRWIQLHVPSAWDSLFQSAPFRFQWQGTSIWTSFNLIISQWKCGRKQDIKCAAPLLQLQTRRMCWRGGAPVIWIGVCMEKMHHSFLTDGFKSCSLFHLVIFREAFNTSHKYLGWLSSLFFFQLCMRACVRATSLPVHWLLLVKSSEQQLVSPPPAFF